MAPRPFLKVKTREPRGWSTGRDDNWLVGELSFDYDGHVLPATSPARRSAPPATPAARAVDNPGNLSCRSATLPTGGAGAGAAEAAEGARARAGGGGGGAGARLGPVARLADELGSELGARAAGRSSP